MGKAEPSTGMRTASTAVYRPEVRKEFAAGMVRLGVWYVHHLVCSRKIPEAKVTDALTRHVNLYRLTTLWDGRHDPALGHNDARWNNLVADLAELITSAAPDQLETGALEARALERLEPYLNPELDPPPQEAFGGWSYQVVGEGISDVPGVLGRFSNPRKLWHKTCRLLGMPAHERHAELHFFNAAAPQSPFDDPVELAHSLSTLVADCRRQYPAVQWLWCSSWLNNRREFLALFPDSWRASAVERSPEDADAGSFGRSRLNTDNWWGQFMRRDGSLNETLANDFRDSGGVFPFPNRLCHARLADVERHLATQLATGGGPC